MSPRALVTGGAGFIGSHVIDLLLQRGWSADVIDDLSTGKRENLSRAARLHVMDVRAPEAARLIAEHPFDAVIHLAGQMDVRRSVAHPLLDASINILGSLNILEALRGAGSKARLVFTSTGGTVYGDLSTPPNAETALKDPDSPYAITKLSVEYYLSYYARIHGMDTVALRLGNVYGPRQDPHGEAGVVAIFCGRIIAGKPLTIFGDGQQTRDYVHVSDVAEAIFLGATAELPPPGRVDARAFNIGTGLPTSVLELAAALLRAAGADVPIEFASNRRGEQQHTFLTVDKARDLLGWSPRVSLADGLADTFASFAGRAAPSILRT